MNFLAYRLQINNNTCTFGLYWTQLQSHICIFSLMFNSYSFYISYICTLLSVMQELDLLKLINALLQQTLARPLFNLYVLDMQEIKYVMHSINNHVIIFIYSFFIYFLSMEIFRLNVLVTIIEKETHIITNMKSVIDSPVPAIFIHLSISRCILHSLIQDISK